MLHHEAFEYISNQVCLAWPEHKRFIGKAWANLSLHATANNLANSILKIAGDDLKRFIEGYRWMCGMMMDEALYFQRHGKYRLSSFAEVEAAVYQNSRIMRLYMDGLLLSQVIWPNHVRAFDFYLRKFVSELNPDSRHLEVGPGHGLLLHYAMQALSHSPEAWDISPHSIKCTHECLDALGGSGKANIYCKDILKLAINDCPRYDSIVLSEVLEHSDDPERMLHCAASILTPGGIIFVNVPVNSPSVDHIYLFRTPEEVANLIGRVGLEIENMLIAPSAGLDEARSRKLNASITCVFLAKKLARRCQ